MEKKKMNVGDGGKKQEPQEPQTKSKIHQVFSSDGKPENCAVSRLMRYLKPI